mgnify:CR=1 FL=1
MHLQLTAAWLAPTLQATPSHLQKAMQQPCAHLTMHFQPSQMIFPPLCAHRIISSISSGEYLPDPSPICTNIGLSEANAVAMSQSGQFVLKVESAMLVVYEWSGKGMTVTWKRRCQLQAPDGYTFRTSE